jgi:hypothetical protein
VQQPAPSCPPIGPEVGSGGFFSQEPTLSAPPSGPTLAPHPPWGAERPSLPRSSTHMPRQIDSPPLRGVRARLVALLLGVHC